MGARLASALFWGSVLLFGYTWMGYPLLVRLWARGRAAARAPGVSGPITVVLAAYNEEDAIAERLRNLAATERGGIETEVIVASDGSTDGTEAVVAAWPDPRVRLLRLPRGGRARAHNAALAAARGQVVVFSDARTAFAPGCVAALAGALADAEVGCAVGRLRYRPLAGGVGEGTAAYWRYETALRRREGLAGWLVVGTGCCMAVRRSLFRPLSPDEDVDDATPLDVLLQGRRVVFVDDAEAEDAPPSSGASEIRARARMTVLTLTAAWRRRGLLVPWRFGRAAVALLSHRILRCLTPLYVAGAFLGAALLVSHPAYRAVLVAQMVAYGMALGGWLLGSAAPRILRLPQAFVAWNVGFAIGLVRLILGRRVTSYTPAT